jgi:hypothetical protein
VQSARPRQRGEHHRVTAAGLHESDIGSIDSAMLKEPIPAPLDALDKTIA